MTEIEYENKRDRAKEREGMLNDDQVRTFKTPMAIDLRLVASVAMGSDDEDDRPSPDKADLYYASGERVCTFSPFRQVLHMWMRARGIEEVNVTDWTKATE